MVNRKGGTGLGKLAKDFMCQAFLKKEMVHKYLPSSFAIPKGARPACYSVHGGTLTHPMCADVPSLARASGEQKKKRMMILIIHHAEEGGDRFLCPLV